MNTHVKLFRIIDSHAFTSSKATDNLRLIGNYFVYETSKRSGARNVYTATKNANRKARTNINFTFLSSKLSCIRGIFFSLSSVVTKVKFKTVFELSENLC